MTDLDPSALLAIVIGLAIRFGIPVLLTALVAWGLRRLDQHWQQQAEHRRPAPTALGAASAEVRCWELTDCPPGKRQTCPAFARPSVPCWQVFRERTGLLPTSCLSCDVFLGAPIRG